MVIRGKNVPINPAYAGKAGEGKEKKIESSFEQIAAPSSLRRSCDTQTY